MDKVMTLRGSAGWKALLVGLLLAVSAGLALALPTAKDVEAAVQAGQYAQAEAMLHEVIQAKPDSAKAHYELGQILNREGRTYEARAELQKAQSLDPSLKFASSPERFKGMLAKLDAALGQGGTVQPTTQPPAVRMSNAPVAHSTPAAPADSSSGFPWMLVLGVLAVIVLVRMFLRRPAAQPMPSAVGAMGNGGVYSPGTAGYPGAPVGGGTPGAGMGGAVLGGVAGLAAGYGLAKMMEHRGDDHSSGSSGGSYTSLDSNVGSAPDLGTFDAGTGDSWDSGGGDMGGSSDGGGDW